MSQPAFETKVDELFKNAQEATNSLEFSFERLAISIFSPVSLSHWLNPAIGFATDNCLESAESTEFCTSYSIRVLSDRHELQSIDRLLVDCGSNSTTYSRRKHIFNRFELDRWTVDRFDDLPVCWLTSQHLNEILVVLDDELSYPGEEIRLGIIDILNRYLEANGWHTIHSGAIKLGNRTWLVMGDSGVGKTSLIAWLVSAGAKFLANERLFIRESGNGLVARTFPQPIALGIGTALRHQGLSSFIADPSELASKQNRWDQTRVNHAKEEELAALPDKLKILPPEFVSTLGVGDCLSRDSIYGLLVPRFEVGGPSGLFSVSPHQVYELLRKNYFPSVQDQTYPRWLPIRLPYSSELDIPGIVNEICQLPTTGVTFNEGENESLLESLQNL